uniref:Uncharacterized protein n=1 Tax=Romanomermis culicivorax TaxID=13658 RepID=A0A915J3Q5_ROMCU
MFNLKTHFRSGRITAILRETTDDCPLFRGSTKTLIGSTDPDPDPVPKTWITTDRRIGVAP